MQTKNSLQISFDAYLDVARKALRSRSAVNSSRVQLLVTKKQELRSLVAEAEASAEFGELVNKSLSLRSSEISQDRVTDEVRNFFRRSGCYNSLYSGNLVDGSALFQDLIGSYRTQQIKRRYLLPLRNFGFAEELIEFDGFSIRRFSVEELEELLKIHIREDFYEWTVPDLSEIEGYWFVDFSQSEPRYRSWTLQGRSGTKSFKDDFDTSSPFVSILEPLLLYDWNAVEGAFVERGETLDIPFVLTVNDDLLHSPDLPPDLPPFQAGVIEKGEEIYPPDYHVYVGQDELERFESAINNLSGLLWRTRASRAEWTFMDVALTFYRQASLSDNGFLRLLWLIITLDALFGEKGGSNLLKKRVSTLFRRTIPEREALFKFLNEMYSLRSSLVHGDSNLLTLNVKDERLYELHNLARRSIIWSFHYLNSVLDVSRVGHLPSRTELLSLLDSKSTQTPMAYLREKLASGFPHIESWFDPCDV